jgi:hypothetical protein
MRLPAGIERIGPTRFPWDPRGRLCFHSLFSLKTLDVAAQFDFFRKLVRDGVRLAPAATRTGTWGGPGPRSISFCDLDLQAGDDRYLFLSPAHPHFGMVALGHPAVAFDIDRLASAGPVAWRSRDLLGAYQACRSTACLRRLARCMTVTGAVEVKALMHEHALAIASTDPSTWPERTERVRPLLPPAACLAGRAFAPVRDLYDPALPFQPRLAAINADEEERLLHRLDYLRVPEVLLEGSVPLCDALFYLDFDPSRPSSTRVWREMRELARSAS